MKILLFVVAIEAMAFQLLFVLYTIQLLQEEEEDEGKYIE